MRTRTPVEGDGRAGRRAAGASALEGAFEGDLGWFADLSGHLPEILKGVAAAHAGITPEAFDEAARRFLDAARHPQFGVPYHRLTYRPMRELLDLLRARGFKVFVASAGGRDFIRAVSEEIYRVGLPPVLAAGNADGDIQMLELARFGILLHHDDAEREYAYDAGAEKALEASAAAGWVVVSMKDDFARVFDIAD
jgi:phosphoserine phosphatase